MILKALMLKQTVIWDQEKGPSNIKEHTDYQENELEGTQ